MGRIQMAATLTLIPTPLSENAPLEASALAALQQAAQDAQALILVEESRPAWRRWLQWGLPRAAISRFINFNEHTSATQTPQVLQALQQGHNAVLFSDTGMPAFCDPRNGTDCPLPRGRHSGDGDLFSAEYGFGLGLGRFSWAVLFCRDVAR